MTAKLYLPTFVAVVLVASIVRGREQPAISPDLQKLFERLDELGRESVSKARYVSLDLRHANGDHSYSVNGWLLDESDEAILVLHDDLMPWRYAKKGTTTLPASWHPNEIKLQTIKDASFEETCKKLIDPPKDQDDFEPLSARHGPSHRLLLAHAAWKQGLAKYIDPLLRDAPVYDKGFADFQAAALEDLAWLHFLRGVNLLMFADRREVVPQLKLAIKVAPDSEYAEQSKDLLKHLEPLIAQEQRPKAKVEYSKLNKEQLAEAYIAKLKDLHCEQAGQPGDIEPYLGVVVGESSPIAPTLLVKQLGEAAVPALIKALKDDTPTRTVYHWRDFDRNRVVWRASDFAWYILRDISGKEFANRRQVGFSFSYLDAEGKKAVIEEVKEWHKTAKTQTPDEKMMAMLSGPVEDEWFKAGAYFLKKKDQRALKPLLDQLSHARQFQQGKLCLLIAKFGDPVSKEPIAKVMQTAKEPSDRLGAAMALYDLGDASGIPVAIDFAKAEPQPYGRWEEPIWFLMHTRSPQGLKTLKEIVVDGTVERSSEVIDAMLASITGDLSSEPHSPAGSAEVYPIFRQALARSDYTGMTINNVKMRTKDRAAVALVLLKDGGPRSGNFRFIQIDPAVFNESEPDEAKRDTQIDEIKSWYNDHEGKLEWDAKRGRLRVKK